VSFGTFVAIRKVLSNLIELFLWKDATQILVVLHRLHLSEDVSIAGHGDEENSLKLIRKFAKE